MSATSFTGVTGFENCPRRYNSVYVRKLVADKQTQAMTWGTEVHAALEQAVSGQQALPPKFQHYDRMVNMIRAAPGKKSVELKWGLNKALAPVGFFGNGVWVRGVIDVSIVGKKNAVVFDYKTGKVKTDSDQLKLFAAATLALNPYLNTVHVRYIWLAHNTITGGSFEKSEAPIIWNEFRARVARMEHAYQTDVWPPKPSGLCRWCPVGKNNCEFWLGYEGEK
jgi:hypothetical protein